MQSIRFQNDNIYVSFPPVAPSSAFCFENDASTRQKRSVHGHVRFSISEDWPWTDSPAQIFATGRGHHSFERPESSSEYSEIVQCAQEDPVAVSTKSKLSDEQQCTSARMQPCKDVVRKIPQRKCIQGTRSSNFLHLPYPADAISLAVYTSSYRSNQYTERILDFGEFARLPQDVVSGSSRSCLP
ncbi:hypothetical protein Trydic_g5889 [Trypoxylus dichotomus]